MHTKALSKTRLSLALMLLLCLFSRFMNAASDFNQKKLILRKI